MRLIDAESLTMLVSKATILSDEFKNVFCKLVYGEPTVDAVPVVRCRECKHGVKVDDQGKWFYCRMTCAKGLAVVRKDDFCNYGERRGDNG